MLNTHINNRLNQWALWSTQRTSGALGFPRQAAFTRLAGSGGFGSKAPDINERAWEIEQAVVSLSPLLCEAVRVFYLGKGTVEQRCKDCHCSKMTLYRRVDEAQAKIMDWLNGYYCGLDEYAEVCRRVSEQNVLQAA